jgi:hypothetical protein
MKRALVLTGALLFVAGLAFLVARPSVEPPAATPYDGVRGASRAKASGLGISFLRGGELRALAPGTPVREGDVLRFAVRAERPRHLLVLLREGQAPAAPIFPAPGTGEAASGPVEPGQKLPIAPVLGPGTGKVIVTAIFADHPFPLSEARGEGNEEIDLVMEKEPRPAGE